MFKLVLAGPSGSGKSTSAKIIKDIFEQKGIHARLEKLATPLYDIQEQMYKICGINDFSQQNQKLLETIATELRKISPTCLVDNIKKRIRTSSAECIINEDLRDLEVDYLFFKKEQYIFIRIWAPQTTRSKRLNARFDVNFSLEAESDKKIDLMEFDYFVGNNSSIKALREKLTMIINDILCQNKVMHS